MRKRITAIGGVILVFSLMQAQNADTSLGTTIINRSPFIPTGFNPSAEGVPASTSQAAAMGYEFRGVYQIGDRYWFLISEPQSRDGNWIELGQNSDSVVARRYDPETKSLTVISNNAEMTLELASIDPNPTPMPVKGLVKTTSRTPVKAPSPVRRTIRPTATGNASSVANPDNKRTSPPPPAWLEKLRAEAAERRARAGQQQGVSDNNSARRRIITPNRPDQQEEGQNEARDNNHDNRERTKGQSR